MSGTSETSTVRTSTATAPAPPGAEVPLLQNPQVFYNPGPGRYRRRDVFFLAAVIVGSPPSLPLPL